MSYAAGDQEGHAHQERGPAPYPPGATPGRLPTPGPRRGLTPAPRRRSQANPRPESWPLRRSLGPRQRAPRHRPPAPPARRHSPLRRPPRLPSAPAWRLPRQFHAARAPSGPLPRCPRRSTPAPRAPSTSTRLAATGRSSTGPRSSPSPRPSASTPCSTPPSSAPTPPQHRPWLVRAALEAAYWRTKVANLVAFDAVDQLTGALAAVDVPLDRPQGRRAGLYALSRPRPPPDRRHRHPRPPRPCRRGAARAWVCSAMYPRPAASPQASSPASPAATPARSRAAARSPCCAAPAAPSSSPCRSTCTGVSTAVPSSAAPWTPPGSGTHAPAAVWPCRRPRSCAVLRRRGAAAPSLCPYAPARHPAPALDLRHGAAARPPPARLGGRPGRRRALRVRPRRAEQPRRRGA